MRLLALAAATAFVANSVSGAPVLVGAEIKGPAMVERSLAPNAAHDAETAEALEKVGPLGFFVGAGPQQKKTEQEDGKGKRSLAPSAAYDAEMKEALEKVGSLSFFVGAGPRQQQKKEMEEEGGQEDGKWKRSLTPSATHDPETDEALEELGPLSFFVGAKKPQQQTEDRKEKRSLAPSAAQVPETEEELEDLGPLSFFVKEQHQVRSIPVDMKLDAKKLWRSHPMLMEQLVKDPHYAAFNRQDVGRVNN